MSTAALENAIKSTRAVLAGVHPEQLQTATPCASWDVAGLIDHIVGGQYFFATFASGAAPSSDAPPAFALGDFLATFDQGAAACVAAFSADGVMDAILHLPFGDMPGSAFVGLAATDTFVHGWDLARATGQNSDLDPALAAGLLEGARPAIGPMMRGDDGQAPFGPETTAPADASNADRLAAFLGRSV
ncbi:MAG: TIGR03086 family metal-binding protein [Ilumatobacteraceae bacterium]